MVAVDAPTSPKRLSSARVALGEEALVGGYEWFTGCSDGIFEAPWVIVVVADMKVYTVGVREKCAQGQKIRRSSIIPLPRTTCRVICAHWCSSLVK